ncbi:MAG: hypothetical protein ACJAV7_002849 [Flavobacteriales bacterium]|jgi:hypothetical protein
MQTRFSYEVAVSEKWFISPQFTWYLGLSNDLEMYNIGSHSILLYVVVRIERELN